MGVCALVRASVFMCVHICTFVLARACVRVRLCECLPACMHLRVCTCKFVRARWCVRATVHVYTRACEDVNSCSCVACVHVPWCLRTCAYVRLRSCACICMRLLANVFVRTFVRVFWRTFVRAHIGSSASTLYLGGPGFKSHQALDFFAPSHTRRL